MNPSEELKIIDRAAALAVGLNRYDHQRIVQAVQNLAQFIEDTQKAENERCVKNDP